jgi:succinate-acetate transporter protein
MLAQQSAYAAGTPQSDVPLHDPALSGQGQIPAPYVAGGNATTAGTNIVGGDAYKYDVLKQSMPGVSIFLRPYAAPSALGFASFFCSCFTLATWYAAWYGGIATPVGIAPFVMMMGIAQIFAALWCYPARDTTGTVFHGTWGSLFLSWGVLHVMITQGFIAPLLFRWGASDEYAMWLVTCAAITGAICLVTLPRDILISSVAAFMFIGSVLIFAGHFETDSEDDSSSRRLVKAGGYFWIFASVVALLRSAIYLLPPVQQDEYTDIISSKSYRGQSRVAIPIGEAGVRRGQ